MDYAKLNLKINFCQRYVEYFDLLLDCLDKNEMEYIRLKQKNMINSFFDGNMKNSAFKSPEDIKLYFQCRTICLLKKAQKSNSELFHTCLSGINKVISSHISIASEMGINVNQRDKSLDTYFFDYQNIKEQLDKMKQLSELRK